MFGWFKKKKKVRPQEFPSGVAVSVDDSSQPEVLRTFMNYNEITHGQTVKADISNVNIRNESGVPKLYFCGITDLILKEQIYPGDGQPLPDKVTVENVNIPDKIFDSQGKSNLYNLKNVKIHSNGKIQIIATADTVFEAR